MYKFKTKIEDNHISYTPINKQLCLNDDVDIEVTTSALVEWHLEIETRDWGVKTILPCITKVGVLFEYEYFDEDDSLIRNSFEISDNTYKLEDNLRVTKNSVMPDNIHVDFDKLNIQVQ
jgi:hypothetical protein